MPPSGVRLLRRQLYAIVGYSNADLASPDASFDDALRKIEAALSLARARADELMKSHRRDQSAKAMALAEIDRLRREQVAAYEGFLRERIGWRAENDVLRASLDATVERASPEELAALQRFADGDRIGAMPVIDAITDAKIRAHKTLAAVEAEKRSRLKDVMLREGSATTAAVLANWLEVTEYDPARFAAWMRVAALSSQVGNVAQMERAYARALSAASSKPERLQAIMPLIILEFGRRDGRRYTEREIELTSELYRIVGKHLDPARMRRDRPDASEIDVFAIAGATLTEGAPPEADRLNPAWENVIRGRLYLGRAHQSMNPSLAEEELRMARDLQARYGSVVRSRRVRDGFVAMGTSIEANIAAARGSKSDAVRAATEAVRVQRLVVASDPSDRMASSTLSGYLSELGAFLEEDGRALESVKAYREAMELGTVDIASDPLSVVNAGAMRELGQSYGKSCFEARIVDQCRAELALLKAKIVAPAAAGEERENLEFVRSNFDIERAGLLLSAARYAEADRELADIERTFRVSMARPNHHPAITEGLGTIIGSRGIIAKQTGHGEEAAALLLDGIQLIQSTGTETPKGLELRSASGLVAIAVFTLTRAQIIDVDEEWDLAVGWFDAAVRSNLLTGEVTDKTAKARLDAARERVRLRASIVQ